MLLVFHIGIALFSIGYSAYVFFSPSQFRLRLTYLLVGITLISGVFLVLLAPGHMVPACITGGVYLFGILTCLGGARHKLAKAKEMS